MSEETKKKRKRKAAADGDSTEHKEHKKNWREYMATVEDIQTFLAGTVLLRQNAISGRPEFRVPTQDEFEALGQVYPTGAKPLDEWRSYFDWQPVTDRLVNTLWQMLKARKDVSRHDIWSVIDSDFVPLYNPFSTYLDHLPPPDQRRGAIFELAMTVTVKGGTEEQTLFYMYLRKWLVGMVAGWIDEVESIKNPREHPIDHDAVFAEAYEDYRNGFQYWFDDEEMQVLQRHNERFEVAKPELELISKYFRVPKENERGEFVSNTEIMQTIGGNLMPRLTSNNLGRAMTALGFKRMRSHGQRGYTVVAYSPEDIKANKSVLAYDARPESEPEEMTSDTNDTIF